MVYERGLNPLGVGSISEVFGPDGSLRGYRATIYIGGRPRRKFCQRHEDVVAWLTAKAQEKREISLGLRREERPRVVAKRALTYRELAEKWLEWLREGHDRVRTEKTLSGYEKELALLLEHWGPRYPMDTTKADVQAWVTRMRGQKTDRRVRREGVQQRRIDGLSTQTIKNRLCRLKQLHSFGVDAGYLAEHPCEVRLPRVVARSVRPAASEERVKELLERSEEPRTRVALLLAADAGLRREEIVALMGHEITFEELRGRRHGWLHLPVYDERRRTKSGRERLVPILTTRLRDALQALTLEAWRPLLFPIKTDRGLDSLLRRELGENPRLHELRHRFGTLTAESGEPLPKVQKWMGHRRIETTMGYVHAKEEPTGRATAALDGSQKRTRKKSYTTIMPMAERRRRGQSSRTRD